MEVLSLQRNITIEILLRQAKSPERKPFFAHLIKGFTSIFIHGKIASICHRTLTPFEGWTGL
jgi:hypothetical protein